MEPVLPAEWEAFDIHYRYRETFHHIHVRRIGEGRVVNRVLLDGAEQPDRMIPLYDDRRDHRVDVEVGVPPSGNP